MKREKLKLKIGSASAGSELYSIDVFSACDLGINPLKQGIIEGENPVFDPELAAYERRSKSRIAWECCSKWVVNFI